MESDLCRVNPLGVSKSTEKRANHPDKVRLLVFEVLTEVNQRGGYSNLLLPRALSEAKYDSRDSAFATELLYGTLRTQLRHDYLLAQVIDRQISDLDVGILEVLRLGAHQIFDMRVATHAAVSESVELAKKVLGESKASYVNAILRRLSAQPLEKWLEPASLLDDPIARLSILHAHPEWIVSAYFDLLKDIDEVEIELRANNQPSAPTYVTWPGKSSPSDFLDLGGKPTRYSPFGAHLDQVPGTLELIKSRKAGVQDEGSQLVAHIFYQVAKNSRNILDLCAGPGGKAALLSHLAHKDKKEFVANEVSTERAELVRKVLCGGHIWNSDGRDIAERGVKFDSVIADVPCTGLGALRRRPEVRSRRKVSDLRSLTELQSQLVDSAISVLSNGGVFGYATCSPHFAETSAQVTMALKRHPNLEQIDVNPYLPQGLQSATRGLALSLWTGKHNTDSMYLALFRKKG